MNRACCQCECDFFKQHLNHTYTILISTEIEKYIQKYNEKIINET